VLSDERSLLHGRANGLRAIPRQKPTWRWVE
jgi:hypothetical protein